MSTEPIDTLDDLAIFSTLSSLSSWNDAEHTHLHMYRCEMARLPTLNMENPQKMMQQLVQEACDPTTAPERLQTLARSSNHSVQQAVASNPNTPIEVLYILDKRHAEAILQNVALPLHLLADAGCLEKFDARMQQAFASMATDGVLLALLARAAHPHVRAAVAGNAYTPKTILRTLSLDNVGVVRRAVACSAFADESILQNLALCRDCTVREGIAGNLHTPISLLLHLLGDEEYTVRQSVLRNPRVIDDRQLATTALGQTVRLLSSLCGDEQLQSYRAASGAATFTDDEWRLMMHIGYWPRYIVAQHHGAPAWVFGSLAADERWEVRRQVARNRAVPAEILEILATDEDALVRSGVAENIQAPLTLLQTLADTDDESVQTIARETLGLLLGHPL